MSLSYLFSARFWRYVLTDTGDRSCGTPLSRAWCRFQGHPDGVVFFNVGGLEPDYHCKNCGEEI